MATKRKRHSAEFKAKVALGGGEGSGNLAAVGQRVPSASSPDHDLEEAADWASGEALSVWPHSNKLGH